MSSISPSPQGEVGQSYLSRALSIIPAGYCVGSMGCSAVPTRSTRGVKPDRLIGFTFVPPVRRLLLGAYIDKLLEFQLFGLKMNAPPSDYGSPTSVTWRDNQLSPLA
jgi:hypothetical protein